MTTPAPESTPSKVQPNDIQTTNAVAATLDGAPVKQQLARARTAAMKFTERVVEAGQAHPKTAAAVLLGAGMLLGSLVYRLAAPRPTAMQLIARALQRGATRTGRSLLSGLSSARKLAV